jgi:hypothetical protein
MGRRHSLPARGTANKVRSEVELVLYTYLYIVSLSRLFLDPQHTTRRDRSTLFDVLCWTWPLPARSLPWLGRVASRHTRGDGEAARCVCISAPLLTPILAVDHLCCCRRQARQRSARVPGSPPACSCTRTPVDLLPLRSRARTVLVARNFVPIAKAKAQSLYDGFSKLSRLDPAQNSVETTDARFIWTGLGSKFFIVLVTRKTSNLVRDFGILRVISDSVSTAPHTLPSDAHKPTTLTALGNTGQRAGRRSADGGCCRAADVRYHLCDG